MTKSEQQTNIKSRGFTEKDKKTRYAIKQLGIKILKPEENDNTFETIIGNERVVKRFSRLVEIFSNPSVYDVSIISKNFMLIGETA